MLKTGKIIKNKLSGELFQFYEKNKDDILILDSNLDFKKIDINNFSENFELYENHFEKNEIHIKKSNLFQTYITLNMMCLFSETYALDLLNDIGLSRKEVLEFCTPEEIEDIDEYVKDFGNEITNKLWF